MILPSPIPRPRRVTAMSRSYDDLQQSLRSAKAQDDSSSIQIGLSVAADDPRRYSRSVQLSQPSEAAWLAQTYGGAPKDYEGDFEDRVNRTNNSQNMSTTANKQENQPLRRPSIRKLVAKRVSTLFNKDFKDGKGKRELAGISRNNREGARGRRPEIPPLSFDGAGDDPDDRSTYCIQTMTVKPTSSSPSPHLPSFCIDGAADEIDNFHNLHSVNLNRALPSLPPTTRHLLTSTIYTNTPSLTYSGASTAHHSTGSTVPSSTNRSTTSSRHDFRNITRDLITPATPNFSPELQPILDPLDPEKFSPASTGNPREMGDA